MKVKEIVKTLKRFTFDEEEADIISEELDILIERLEENLNAVYDSVYELDLIKARDMKGLIDYELGHKEV